MHSGAALKGSRVAVLGYGNQGRAQALNLRDSGVEVMVGHRVGSCTAELARADGFTPCLLADAVPAADLVVITAPDEAHPQVWEAIARSVTPETVIGFCHGLSVHFALVKIPTSHGVVLVAPKGPGASLRQQFVQDLGIPALVATHQPGTQPARTLELRNGWAAAIGCTRAGIIETSFAAECITDLFGEQAVLCGGISELIRAAFETLVEAGYPADLAYNECCQEVALIGDLILKRGLAGMQSAISTTAAFGIVDAGPRLIDPGVRQRLREVLRRVESGEFVTDLMTDAADGMKRLHQSRAAAAEHPIERAAEKWRAESGKSR